MGSVSSIDPADMLVSSASLIGLAIKLKSWRLSHRQADFIRVRGQKILPQQSTPPRTVSRQCSLRHLQRR
jgi:hypothetical protein